MCSRQFVVGVPLIRSSMRRALCVAATRQFRSTACVPANKQRPTHQVEPAAKDDQEEDHHDEHEEPPSRFKLAIVSGLLTMCVTALSMVSQRGASITAFLTLRQELMVLSMMSLMAGYQVCAWLALFTRSRMESAQADTTAAIFMQGVVKYGSLAVAATCLLGSLGVNINGLTAALASSGIAIGLASQRVLENLAAGLMLMVFRTFEVGDLVQISGKVGIVYKISLIATRIDTLSNVRLSIPNKDVFGSVVENWSRNPMRRAEVEVAAAGSSDVKAVRQTLQSVVGNYQQYAARFIDEKRKHRRSKLMQRRNNGTVPITPAKVLPSMVGNMLQHVSKLNSFQDYITISNLGEAKEEQFRSGMEVSLPRVVLKEIKTWGYLWEVRVFLPVGQFDVLRCQLVEELAIALKDNSIRMVADIMEERRKIVGAS